MKPLILCPFCKSTFDIDVSGDIQIHQCHNCNNDKCKSCFTQAVFDDGQTVILDNINFYIMDIFVAIRFRANMMRIGNSHYLNQTFEPDFSDIDKLSDKIKLYLTFT